MSFLTFYLIHILLCKEFYIKGLDIGVIHNYDMDYTVKYMLHSNTRQVLKELFSIPVFVFKTCLIQ